MRRKEKRDTDMRDLFFVPREERIAQAVEISRRCFLEGETHRTLSRTEFFLWQISYVQKRWWAAQFFLLLFLGGALLSAGDGRYAPHLLGVLGTDFVILLIPELFKNKASAAVEIEGAAYYSLRQIYAARILAFGLADIFLLALFGAVAVWGAHMDPGGLLVHFFLPLTVTGCICFRVLTSRRISSEPIAILLCLLWSAVWYMTTLYLDWQEKVGMPVWAMVFLLCCGYLWYAVQRALTAREVMA